MSSDRTENWPGRLPHPPSRPGHALAHLDNWAAEVDQDLRTAAQRFWGARRTFVDDPTPVFAATPLEAVLELVDLGDLTGHQPPLAGSRAPAEVSR